METERNYNEILGHLDSDILTDDEVLFVVKSAISRKTHYYNGNDTKETRLKHLIEKAKGKGAKGVIKSASRENLSWSMEGNA